MVCRKCEMTETSAHLRTLYSHKPGDFSKNFIKPGDSVKELEILAGYFFHSDKFEDKREKVTLTFLVSNEQRRVFPFLAQNYFDCIN